MHNPLQVVIITSLKRQHMHVCMYVYVCMCMYVCMYVCMHVYKEPSTLILAWGFLKNLFCFLLFY